MGLKNSVSLLSSGDRKVRVMIADPYPVILYGLLKMIEDDTRFQVVAAISTTNPLTMMILEERPDVVLIDLHMALQHPDALPLLRTKFHPASIILLTGSEKPEEIRNNYEFDEQPILSKWSTAEGLRQALTVAVAVGSRPKTVGLSTAAQAHTSPALTDPAQRIAQLTKRERQILPLVCSGMKNKEIAKRLGIAESTVWHHLTSVFTKLEVEDRLGLAAFAYRHSLADEYEAMPLRTVQSA
jgi:two-component system nitrate/nitrite response regulator NarL